MTCLKDKVALVTGASRGIGRAIAIKFAQSGAKVVVNYASNEAEAQKTLELMGEHKTNASIMQFDVSDEQAVSDAVSAIGQVDILVNNAGIYVDALLIRLKSDDFDRQLAINLKGAFNCAKACARPMMKTRWGRIINISSVVGEMGNAGQSVYAATKAGLIGMTKSLARELASRNILVNAITPGYIETDMTKDMNELASEALLAHVPLKRMGKPEDIAHAAAFLASSDADYITGQVLSVNGGMYM
jgi:3-oxoacyl-[acyl-carrier protein] reductase